jgi:hypothetical protein
MNRFAGVLPLSPETEASEAAAGAATGDSFVSTPAGQVQHAPVIRLVEKIRIVTCGTKGRRKHLQFVQHRAGRQINDGYVGRIRLSAVVVSLQRETTSLSAVTAHALITKSLR